MRYEDLSEQLIRECHRRLIGECIPRIRKCLNMLSDEQIWSRPNDHSNSIGNLVLHLHGNVRQWMGSGLAGMEDVRQRDLEFTERGPLPKAELLERLDQTEKLVEKVLADLPPARLLEVLPVQIYEESGVAILIHVVEHFSYHVGQISWITKAALNQDLGYYAGQNL